MRIMRGVLASALLLAVSATANAQTRAGAAARDETARLRSTLENSGARMADAFSRGDIGAFVSGYASDAWFFPPNAEPFQGAAAAAAFFRTGYERGIRNLQLRTTGMERSGNLAYESGTYTSDYPDPAQGGAMARDYGKYLHIWKRDARGTWRIHQAIWSSNLPAPAMTR